MMTDIASYLDFILTIFFAFGIAFEVPIATILVVWAGFTTPEALVQKRPYETLTGRQQYYVDHEWFLKYGEALPTHLEPLAVNGYPVRFVMGHARHGVHSMWRDDPLMLQLQPLFSLVTVTTTESVDVAPSLSSTVNIIVYSPATA